MRSTGSVVVPACDRPDSRGPGRPRNVLPGTACRSHSRCRCRCRRSRARLNFGSLRFTIYGPTAGDRRVRVQWQRRCGAAAVPARARRVCAALAKHAGKCNQRLPPAADANVTVAANAARIASEAAAPGIGLTPGHISKRGWARRRCNGNEACACSCTRRCCSRFSTPSARARRLHCLARCVHAGSSRTRFAP